MKVKNSASISQTKERQDFLAILEAGLSAVDTKNSITSRVKLVGNHLRIDEEVFPLKGVKRIFLVGIGKCAQDACVAFSTILGEKLTAGMLIDTKPPLVIPKVVVVEGDHPFPSARNISFTKNLLAFLQRAEAHDLILFVISGGGSVLLAQPPAPMTFEDEKGLIDALFKTGADIYSLNTVRKHLSLARGGYLAQAAYPARVISLIFSDVPGNNISFIASGPTVEDSTTAEDANNVLVKFGGDARISKYFIETPKDEKYFKHVKNILFLSNQVALYAMAKKATSLGYTTDIKTDTLAGRASDTGERIAKEIQAAPAGTVFLYGGETTVEVGGTGKGGRNQELSLSALRHITHETLVSSVASDGIDNGPHAAGIADARSLAHAQNLGLKPAAFLEKHDSFSFFEKTGDFVLTEKTGSNVADLVVALKRG